MVKDGHTIVIGGLFREASTRSRSQIPGLGSLPIVGGLFGRQSDNTIREEVIILLTPHLIKDDLAYSEVSEEEASHAERIRVGMRRGMMWFGRERLAEGHYKSAARAHAKGNNGNALWHLNMALNLNPKLVEAMDLKARIQGKDVTSVDSSSVHEFVKRAILHDRAAATQPGMTEVEQQDFQSLPTPDASAQATPGQTTEESVPETHEPVTEPTIEAAVPVEPVSRNTRTPAARRAPEVAETPARREANGEENATTPSESVSETPVEPIEGEFAPE
jgi:type IV pilus assembly protein PilQ